MLIAQAVGFLGMSMNFISFQQNTNKRIVSAQIFGALFFSIHFMLLGTFSSSAYTGAVLNLLGLARNIVFFNRPKKWASNKSWLYIFIIAYIITGLLTWSSIISLLPIVAMTFGTISLYIINPKLTRRFALVCSIGWMIYNVFNVSIAGFVCEFFSIASIVIATIKYDLSKSKH